MRQQLFLTSESILLIRQFEMAVEVGALVPTAPKRQVDYRPNRPLAINTTDVFVDKNRLNYFTDFSRGGLHIAEYLG